MAKTYKPRKWKKTAKPKAKVSAPVKDYIKKAINRTTDKKIYSITGSGSLNNNVATNQYAVIFDVGLIPRYDATSTSSQEGSLAYARTKDKITLRNVQFTLYLHNNSAFNQFIRIIIFKNTNMYEEYATDGANMYEDQTGTQIAYSTALLQGHRLDFNSDMIKSPKDLLCDKIIPLPYDSSHEGGSIPISYIRTIKLNKKLMHKLIYESAPDDVSQISPKDGRYIIFFHHIHGQASTANNCLVNFEWKLDQFYEE